MQSLRLLSELNRTNLSVMAASAIRAQGGLAPYLRLPYLWAIQLYAWIRRHNNMIEPFLLVLIGLSSTVKYSWRWRACSGNVGSVGDRRHGELTSAGCRMHLIFRLSELLMLMMLVDYVREWLAEAQVIFLYIPAEMSIKVYWHDGTRHSPDMSRYVTQVCSSLGSS